MKLIRAVVVAILLLVCAISSQAQPSTIQQLQNNQLNTQQQFPLPGLHTGTNAPELYPGENADVGPQYILRQNPRPTYFEVWLDSQVYYSDNANYAEPQERIKSAVYVNTIQAAFAPPAIDLHGGKLAPTAGYASQWYNYDSDKLSSLDFNAQTAFANLRYSFSKWVATVNFNYTRLLSQDAYIQTYQEFLPSLALQRYFVINDKMLLSVGDQVDYHVTEVPAISFTAISGGGTNRVNSETDLNDHFDNIVFVTFNYQITSHFALQPYYRFQYSFYRRNQADDRSRDDFLNALGIVAYYNFNKYVSVRAFVNFNSLKSDDSGVPSYNEINGGVGGSLDIKF